MDVNVLITGGCGFIGSNLAKKFYDNGYKIFIIDDLSTGNLENLENIKYEFEKLNVANRRCEKIFKNNRFDIVIHLSAQVDVKTSVEHPYLDSRSNLLGLTNMLELSHKNGVKRFIFASSAAVYGNTEVIPISESSKIDPISPYGMSKAVGEFYCRKWKEIYGLSTLCFRFSNVYGPRQGTKGEAGVVSIFMNKIMNDEGITIYGDGNQTRDFIYVEDLTNAVYKASTTDITGVMNLSTNTGTSLNDMVDVLGKMHRLNITYEKTRPGDIYNSRLDNKKVMSQIDWKPEYSFEIGLSKTFQWYQNHIKNLHNKHKKKAV